MSARKTLNLEVEFPKFTTKRFNFSKIFHKICTNKGLVFFQAAHVYPTGVCIMLDRHIYIHMLGHDWSWLLFKHVRGGILFCNFTSYGTILKYWWIFWGNAICNVVYIFLCEFQKIPKFQHKHDKWIKILQGGVTNLWNEIRMERGMESYCG